MWWQVWVDGAGSRCHTGPGVHGSVLTSKHWGQEFQLPRSHLSHVCIVGQEAPRELPSHLAGRLCPWCFTECWFEQCSLRCHDPNLGGTLRLTSEVESLRGGIRQQLLISGTSRSHIRLVRCDRQGVQSGWPWWVLEPGFLAISPWTPLVAPLVLSGLGLGASI